MNVQRTGSMREFPRRLQERLDELDWNRRVLAEKMDVSVATVGNWLRGICFPEIGSRGRLCELLGMSAKQLRLPPFDEED
ncbi:MAG TPA: helix-turn-helix transcriptional regulator [Ktedonobacterales bacterium]|nr:helix-turn-helix transcriptional regulator [Ktedonobacterales bacterium]